MKKRIIALTVVIIITLASFAAPVYADYYSSYTTLRYNMTGPEVTNLQRDLIYLGYLKVSPTGQFGPLTKSAVISFQRNNGLLVDGIVGHQTAREIKVEKVMIKAKQYQGVPYKWGGVSPSGFDCSGFTHYVFLKNGITIPRVSKDQYKAGSWVSKSQLRQGDLVFFTTYAPGPSHVGIYLGGNKFIHASSGAGKVIISDLTNSYYTSHYIGAKRVIW